MRRVALLCAPLLLVAGCTGGGSHPASDTGTGRSGPVLPIRPATTPTGAELHYGTGIGHLPGVTYQPDVVVLGGGASAIRSADATGYRFTIDGSAPGARKLRVGSVMVATTRATGRVLAVKDDPDGDRDVVLGRPR